MCTIVRWTRSCIDVTDSINAMDTLKSQLKALLSQRDALEKQVAERSALLEKAGVGMSSPLIDAEV